MNTLYKIYGLMLFCCALSAAEVTSFTLVNADNGSDIQVLNNAAVLNLAELPTSNLNIRANADGVGSVRMVLSGAMNQTQTESAAPYALYGDNGASYYAWTPALGNYSLTATPYTGSAASGNPGTTLSVTFSVINESSNPNPPPANGLNIPNGRLAFSHDGNEHDHDDFCALAMNGALVWAAGIADRVVHIDHSDHIGGNIPFMEQEMIETANGIIARFDIDADIVFNDQTQLAAAIANFKAEAEKSSANNPLWYFCAGPMEVPWRCINAVDPAYHQFIHCISHGTWNEVHQDTAEMTHDWDDMKADFPNVHYHDIIDQNDSDGDNDWSTPLDKWYWLRDSSYEPYAWVYSRNDFNFKFDPSDAGMTYWFMTGGPNGGDQASGWPEAKALLEGALNAPPTNQAPNAVIEVSATSGLAPASINFTGGNSTDSDGTVTAYAWDFGDGQSSQDMNPSHTYTEAGTYAAQLTVTDDDGASDSEQVTITVHEDNNSGQLPAGWNNIDLGQPGLAGSASESSGAWQIVGGGADIWGTNDEGHLAYRSLNGDGSIAVKILSQSNTHHWAKAGVMIRESVADNAKHAFVAMTPGNGVSFQYRSQTGSSMNYVKNNTHSAPYWLRLVRSGDVFEAYTSTSGSSWQLIASTSISMNNSVIVGMAVTAHDDTTLSTALFDQVTVQEVNAPQNQAPQAHIDAPTTSGPAPLAVQFDGSASSDSDGSIVSYYWDFGDGNSAQSVNSQHTFSSAGTHTVVLTVTDDDGATNSSSITITSTEDTSADLPAPWLDVAIGNPGLPGAASELSGTFALTGGGADIWGTLDGGHMIYQSLDGDGSITARVSSVEHSHYWAKAGVMIRENTAAGSKHAFALCSANAGIAFQRRVSTNGASSHTSGANAQAPYWVRLDRVGDTFSAYQSVDGVNWVLFGSSTITMQSNVLIGLVVTAHDDTKTCNATFDNVSVISAMAGNG